MSYQSIATAAVWGGGNTASNWAGDWASKATGGIWDDAPTPEPQQQPLGKKKQAAAKKAAAHAQSQK